MCNSRLSFMNRAILSVATGLGLGYSPFAPGTCGALLGIPLGLALSRFYGNLWIQIGVALALTLLAIPVCDAAEKLFGKKDDGRIVADEYMLLPICFIGQGPIWDWLVGGEKTLDAVVFLVIAFVISRAVDILKPSPCRQIQSVKGGLGIVLDDFVASLYSWILVWGLFPYAMRLFA